MVELECDRSQSGLFTPCIWSNRIQASLLCRAGRIDKISALQQKVKRNKIRGDRVYNTVWMFIEMLWLCACRNVLINFSYEFETQCCLFWSVCLALIWCINVDVRRALCEYYDIFFCSLPQIFTFWLYMFLFALLFYFPYLPLSSLFLLRSLSPISLLFWPTPPPLSLSLFLFSLATCSSSLICS